MNLVSYHPLLVADHNFLLTSQRPLDQRDTQAVAEAEAVFLPQAPRRDLYQLVIEYNKPHFPRARVQLELDGKVGNHRLFSNLGLPQPVTMAFDDLDQAAKAWQAGQAPGGGKQPLVAKGAGGGEGQNVFLVRSPEELAELGPRLETSCPRGPEGLVLQELVPTGGRDIRVIFMGDYLDAFWRVAPEGDFRSNLSQGGRVERETGRAELDRAVALALRLKETAGLDLAAVDILPGPEGPLLLEINFYFGRQALGGSENYWRLYLEAARGWLAGLGLDPGRISLAD
jgi:ribosomal protein S6--L-glutamate ligase